MVFVDSNVFIVDRFYPRDALYPQNRIFVEKLASFEAAVSVITVLELCGAASSRLSDDELASWLFSFDKLYPVSVVNVHGLAGTDSEMWWRRFLTEVSANIAKKMSYGDASFLREVENHGSEAIVTWNTKEFAHRTQIPVLTPTGYLRRH